MLHSIVPKVNSIVLVLKNVLRGWTVSVTITKITIKKVKETFGSDDCIYGTDCDISMAYFQTHQLVGSKYVQIFIC